MLMQMSFGDGETMTGVDLTSYNSHNSAQRQFESYTGQWLVSAKILDATLENSMLFYEALRNVIASIPKDDKSLLKGPLGIA